MRLRNFARWGYVISIDMLLIMFGIALWQHDDKTITAIAMAFLVWYLSQKLLDRARSDN